MDRDKDIKRLGLLAEERSCFIKIIGLLPNRNAWSRHQCASLHASIIFQNMCSATLLMRYQHAMCINP